MLIYQSVTKLVSKSYDDFCHQLFSSRDTVANQGLFLPKLIADKLCPPQETSLSANRGIRKIHQLKMLLFDDLCEVLTPRWDDMYGLSPVLWSSAPTKDIWMDGCLAQR